MDATSLCSESKIPPILLDGEFVTWWIEGNNAESECVQPSTWRVSVATTLLSPRQDWVSRRPTLLLLLLPVALAAHVADTVARLLAVGRAEEMTWEGIREKR